MKIAKKVIPIICIIVLLIPCWFFYKFVTLPTYRIYGEKIIYKNNVYEVKDNNFTDTDRVGKAIGIVINGDEKRSLWDFFFCNYVNELKDDKDHNLIYVAWLMGPYVLYEKVPQ